MTHLLGGGGWTGGGRRRSSAAVVGAVPGRVGRAGRRRRASSSAASAAAASPAGAAVGRRGWVPARSWGRAGGADLAREDGTGATGARARANRRSRPGRSSAGAGATGWSSARPRATSARGVAGCVAGCVEGLAGLAGPDGAVVLLPPAGPGMPGRTGPEDQRRLAALDPKVAVLGGLGGRLGRGRAVDLQGELADLVRVDVEHPLVAQRQRRGLGQLVVRRSRSARPWPRRRCRRRGRTPCPSPRWSAGRW